ANQPGRAQIVHVAGDDIWVLAKGELRLRHLDLFGQRIVDIWQEPLRLGSPLHASQVNEASKTAFVVTQDLVKPTCLISAIDASGDDGKVRWQRQLGVLSQSDPFVFDDKIWILDEGG